LFKLLQRPYDLKWLSITVFKVRLAVFIPNSCMAAQPFIDLLLWQKLFAKFVLQQQLP